MAKTFYKHGTKHHVVQIIDDDGNEVVLHKHWSKRNACWRYGVDSKRMVAALQGLKV